MTVRALVLLRVPLGAVRLLLLLWLLLRRLLLLISTGVPRAAKTPAMPSVLGRGLGGKPLQRIVLRGVAWLAAPETRNKLGK